MRKNVLRLSAFLMTAILLVTSAACSSAGKTADSKNGTEDTQKQADGKLKLPQYKLDDKTVKILGEVDNNPTLDDLINRFEKAYGGKVEKISSSYNEKVPKLATLVMSGDAPDVYLYSSQDFPSTVFKDLLQPSDGIINYEDPVWDGVKPVIDKYAINGKRYLVVSALSKSNGYVIYNKKLFEESGVEEPRSLYKNGKWNWDTFLDAARKLTYDRNNDGSIDVYGVNMSLPEAFVSSTGKHYFEFNQDGTVKINLREPELTRAMEFLAALGPAKYNVLDTGNWQNNMKAGKLAMVFQHVGNVLRQCPEMVKNGELSYVPIPADPKAAKHYIYGYTSGSFIPKGAKNPTGAAAWMSYQRYAGLDEEEVKKGREAQKALGLTDEDLDLFDSTIKNYETVVDFNRGLKGDSGKLAGDLVAPVIRGQVPWSKQLEAKYPEWQAAADALAKK